MMQYNKHGLTNHRLYATWRNMRDRCNYAEHPSYKDYGGRGITICERWNDFANFVADMGDRPDGMSLDRRDNNGNYEPSNCRWATKSQQQLNQRIRSDNKSGYKGVYWYPKYSKWQAQASRKTIGYFDTREQAAEAIKLWRAE